MHSLYCVGLLKFPNKVKAMEFIVKGELLYHTQFILVDQLDAFR